MTQEEEIIHKVILACNEQIETVIDDSHDIFDRYTLCAMAGKACIIMGTQYISAVAHMSEDQAMAIATEMLELIRQRCKEQWQSEAERN